MAQLFNIVYADLIIAVRKAKTLGVEIVPENFHDMFIGKDHYGIPFTEQDFFFAWHAVLYMLEKHDEKPPTYEEPAPVSGVIDGRTE